MPRLIIDFNEYFRGFLIKYFTSYIYLRLVSDIFLGMKFNIVSIILIEMLNDLKLIKIIQYRDCVK